MTPDRTKPRPDHGTTPLRPVETLIMTMLAAGDRHGYGIRQDIIDFTDGQLALEAGNLYRHIRRLEAAGTVEETAGRARDEDERRIYYRLTPLGRRTLAAELRRMQALVRFGEERRIIPGSVPGRPG